MEDRMKTLGLISPNLDDPTIQEYYSILPEGIEIKGRPLEVGSFTDETFAKVEEAFADVVRDLTRDPLDFLMITGELFLSYRGPGSDRLVLDSVREITPVNASTVLTAVVRALKSLDVYRVVMASPFPHDQDENLIRFLDHYNIEVAANRGLGYDNTQEIWELPPETGYDLAAAVLAECPNVDGIYMPCNKWRVSSVIERLEADLGKPVITNTQAWIWEALRGLGLKTSLPGYGRLLK
jgi:maleate cis-trans isomerase